jgi:DNA-directed RNA polymerase specialized sigma24 family protein
VAERLSLHDIDDGVAFVAAITNRSGLELSWADREDLQQFLLTTAWEISLTFEPGRSGVTFSSFAGTILRRRVVDWRRKSAGGRTKWTFKTHTYERQLPSFVPFDDSAVDRLERTQPEGGGDREVGSDLGDGGLVVSGDRQRARDFELLGLEPDGRAA